MWIFLVVFIGACILGWYTAYKISKKTEKQILNQIDKDHQLEKEQRKKQLLNLQTEIDHKMTTLQNLGRTLLESQQNAKEAAQSYYEQEKENAKQRLAFKEQQLKELYEQKVKELDDLLAQAELNNQNQLVAQEMEIQKSLNALNDIQKRVDCATEALKKAEAERTQKDFYRIHLAQQDIEEIAKIRSIEPYLRDRTVLNKVIWKSYYEKPVNDMIGRVVGTSVRTGIYKITDINSGRCYIGQSVDISTRFKQHIKKGLGADNPGQGKLYAAMLASGPENFTFEIIEDCPKEELDEKEKFYMDFFHAKDFGYSIKAG